MEIFYDKMFMVNMDENPYLLGFTNGMLIFQNKIFRQGYAQDYITKTTGHAYEPFNKEKHGKIAKDIHNFKQTVPSSRSVQIYVGASNGSNYRQEKGASVQCIRRFGRKRQIEIH